MFSHAVAFVVFKQRINGVAMAGSLGRLMGLLSVVSNNLYSKQTNDEWMHSCSDKLTIVDVPIACLLGSMTPERRHSKVCLWHKRRRSYQHDIADVIDPNTGHYPVL